MSAIVPAYGPVRQLDRRADPPLPLTENDVQQPSVLVRLLRTIMTELGVLRRRFVPRHLDFEDQPFLGDGTTVYRLEHRFAGRVRLYAVEWDSGGSGAFDYSLDASNDNNTAAFVTYVAGTGTIRIEESG